MTVIGAIPSGVLIGALLDTRAAGHFVSDAFSALIDLSRFTGAIDWEEIKQIGGIMPKGDCTTNKNAYVVRDEYLAMVAKITGALFPHTECASFRCDAEARTWLGWV